MNFLINVSKNIFISVVIIGKSAASAWNLYQYGFMTDLTDEGNCSYAIIRPSCTAHMSAANE